MSSYTRPDPRRRVNLTVRESLLRDARAAKLNLSRFVEEKLEQALKEERGRRWQEENAEAIEHHRRRIERDGMWNKDLISF
ncbi:acetoacetyl-CoA synthase [Solimonas sp. K1W22B-7]|uniref:type II toxin-antitoxin system CcdA family antitoxin n=1 Tax=Solimonas sp. K1W22B-7 TaxID=2303331 RepID=UPI000E3368A5|nr:type II toxin-antitoxin system CcdA family antitoxin [Solimonas sp. K1W22B-7]AXQ31572.1 acetoacetyl-CoA synthase [Solimonas sp. K1W22B-7]